MEGMGGLQEMEPCWGTAGRGLTEGTGGYGTWSPPGELRDVGAWRERGGLWQMEPRWSEMESNWGAMGVLPGGYGRRGPIKAFRET